MNDFLLVTVQVLYYASLALKAQGVSWPRPVPERSAVQEAGGQKVYDAEGSLLQAPAASGAI